MIVADIFHVPMVKWSFDVVLRLRSGRSYFLHHRDDVVLIYPAWPADVAVDLMHLAVVPDVAYSVESEAHDRRASVERASVVKDVANPAVAIN